MVVEEAAELIRRRYGSRIEGLAVPRLIFSNDGAWHERDRFGVYTAPE